MEPERSPKLGLALSGGGHRAALFHIGVLARLAELDRLRDVQVISTVSGGSVVGTLYYLLLRHQLQTVRDRLMTREVYLEIVRDLERRYRSAVATSFRGRALARLRVVCMLWPTYSRTNLIATVFEERLYRKVLGARGPVHMSDLLVKPMDNEGRQPSTFDPGKENVHRNAPVPILVLNSTALNTGHSFRFEAEYVGEPEARQPLELDADKNTRLIRVPYELLPKKVRKRFTLGFAVSASAAFPVGFAPLAIGGMYGAEPDGRERRFLVRLTDGGVRDNQGVDGLLDHHCTELIVSDGSSQTPDLSEPAGTIVGVLPRVGAIEGKQSREQRLYHADADREITSFSFVHLQTGIAPETLDPLGTSEDAADYRDTFGPPPATTGIDAGTQRLIAGIRTDLDAFSETECFALEELGYRAARAVLPDTGVAPEPWPFSAIGPALVSGDEWLERRLRVASKKFFKPLFLLLEAWRIRRGIRVAAAAVLAVAALAALAWVGFRIGGGVSAQALYGVLVGLAAAAALYLNAGTHGLRLLSRILLGTVPYLPLIPLLFVAGVAMRFVGWIHVRTGRVRARPG
ncbi:MAG TPA: patatin-like phospholipase family protein [Gaiellaceae bacterium]|nr:patatin-like phospholipase family protein [Gaiellaceae bacterium]